MHTGSRNGWLLDTTHHTTPVSIRCVSSTLTQAAGQWIEKQAASIMESGEWTVDSGGQWTVESGEHMQFGIMEKTRTKSHEGIHCDIFLKGYGLHLMTTT